MASRIIVNAKTQRPGVCNALETLLVHRDVAARFCRRLPRHLPSLQVELRGDEAVWQYAPQAKPATEEDWAAEYLELILACKVVDDHGCGD